MCNVLMRFRWWDAIFWFDDCYGNGCNSLRIKCAVEHGKLSIYIFGAWTFCYFLFCFAFHLFILCIPLVLEHIKYIYSLSNVFSKFFCFSNQMHKWIYYGNFSTGRFSIIAISYITVQLLAVQRTYKMFLLIRCMFFFYCFTLEHKKWSKNKENVTANWCCNWKIFN